MENLLNTLDKLQWDSFPKETSNDLNVVKNCIEQLKLRKEKIQTWHLEDMLMDLEDNSIPIFWISYNNSKEEIIDFAICLYFLKMYFVCKLFNKNVYDAIDSDINYVVECVSAMDFETYKTINEIDLFLLDFQKRIGNTDFLKLISKMHYTSFYHNFIKK